MTQPSDGNERATTKPVHIPTVLAVGCSDALLARCWECLAGMGVMVRDCEPSRAATLAAARHPLVIVVARAVYALDPSELQALARDVRAILLPVDEEAAGRELSEALVAAIRAARRPERRSSSGRYSILPGELVALPAAVPATRGPGLASTAPPASASAPPTSMVRPSSLALDPLPDDLVAALR